MHRAFVQAAENQARRLRSDLALPPTGPVDPHAVAESLGILVVRPQDIPDLAQATVNTLLACSAKVWSGFSFEAVDSAVIVINPNQTLQRLKPTIMEEIVHLLLGHRPSEVHKNDGGRDFHETQEREAYAVAAALLLPRKDIVDAFRRGEFLREIAERYGVSEELVRFRINVLHLNEDMRRRLALKDVLSGRI